MSEPKTKPNDSDATAAIDALSDATRKIDAFKLLEIFSNATGQPPKMWGGSIIGFGKYEIKAHGNKPPTEWPLVAFSPRKQNLTLYVMNEQSNYDALLEKLGKHKTGKACLYINTLTDVDLETLEKIVKQSYLDAKAQLTYN